MSIQNLSVIVEVFLHPALVPQEVEALKNCDSLCSLVSLSPFGGNHLPCDLTSLMDLRRVVDFSFCSAFTC